MGLWLKAALLLCIVAACSAACGDGNSVSTPVLCTLTSDKWPLDSEPIPNPLLHKPNRKDVFCSEAVLTPPNPAPNVQRALQGLCASRDPFGNDFFSSSALDSFMAGRFAGNYSYYYYDDAPSLNSTKNAASTTPFSTEPNTPWLLADYMIIANNNQTRFDSWRAAVGEAQIDVLLCGDADCKVLIDVQRVAGRDGSAPLLALTLSGISTMLATGLGTVRSLQGAAVSNIKIQGVAPDVVGTVVIQEIAWRAQRPLWIVDQPDGDPPLANVLPAKATAMLQRTGAWSSMRYGHYKADIVLPGKHEDREYLHREGRKGNSAYPTICITLIWPAFTWLEEHGWGMSDHECEQKFKATTASLSRSSGQPTVYVFDSYVPQARIISNDTNVTRVLTMLPFASTREIEWSTIASNAGAFTADKDGFPATHAGIGCILPCRETSTKEHRNGIFFDCPGNCTVLNVGTATIAAVPLYNLDAVASEQAFHRFFEMLKTIREGSVPWCRADAWGDNMFETRALTALAQAFDGNNQILANCSFWDSVGVGFAHKGWNLTHGRSPPHTMQQDNLQALVNISSFYNLVRPAGNQLRLGHMQVPLDLSLIEMAMRTLLADASRLLEQQLAQELATLDGTKTWKGALLDLSVTLVALVAMSSGQQDIINWFKRMLGAALRHRASSCTTAVAKVAACVLVLLGVVLAPVFIVMGEMSARRNNPDGNTSKLGWLAAPFPIMSRVEVSQRDSMLVGAVTTRVWTRYDDVATGLVYANLALACAGALLICIDVFRPDHERRQFRRLKAMMRAQAAQAQQALGVPAGSAA
jgi:hypothetical protein